MEDNDILSQRVIHQPPSCLEFCPANPSVFVVGTYELDASQTSCSTEGISSQSRSGQIELYQIRQKASSLSFGISQCLYQYAFPDCAVLDLHFRPQHPTFFGVCTSTSHMIFFSLEVLENNQKEASIVPSILKLGSLRMSQENAVLATSFAWNTQPNTYDPHYMSLAVTFSSGEVKLVGITRSAEAKPSGLYSFQIVFEACIDPAHTLEAWTVAFADLSSSAEHKKLLLTGGDDSIMACHSINSELDSSLLSTTELFQDRKSHAAGVTAILPILDPSQVNTSTKVFVTGSYDEHIRVFTIGECPPRKRQVVAELRLGGGVWRLRELSQFFSEEREGGRIFSVVILVSCMHAGVRIVRITRKQPLGESQNGCMWQIDVVGQFTDGHESMCYGADCMNVRGLVHAEDGVRPGVDPMTQRQQSGSSCCDNYPPWEFVVVSTSFYDRKLCVWSFLDDTTELGQVDGV
jgi:diphthine methyl ester acylhydrolase